MELEKILKLIEQGNNYLLVPVSTKVSPLQFIAIGKAAKKRGEDLSTYLRNAVFIRMDNDRQETIQIKPVIDEVATDKKELIEISDQKDKDLAFDKSKFLIAAFKKYITAEGLPLPTEDVIIQHWPEGGISKSNIEFMIEALKKYIVASKRKIPTESELILLWVEGKTIPAPFFRRREIVAPEKLPNWLIEKFKGM